MTLKDYAGGAADTTFTASLTIGATSATLTSATGLPATTPFVLRIDEGLPTDEKVLVLTRSGVNITSMTRGYDGTVAAAHSAGAVVSHQLDALTIKEANAHVEDVGRKHGTDGIADNAVTSIKIADGNVGTDELATGSVTLAKLAASLVDRLFDVGDVKWRAHATAPSANWVVADGAAISRATFAAAFALLGTAYGVGDGLTTFNLPNLVDSRIEGAATNAARAQKAADTHSHTKSGAVSSTGAVSTGNNSVGHSHSIPAGVTLGDSPGHGHDYFFDNTGSATPTSTSGPNALHIHSYNAATSGSNSVPHTHDYTHGHGDTIAYAAASVGSVTKLVPYIKVA